MGIAVRRMIPERHLSLVAVTLASAGTLGAGTRTASASLRLGTVALAGTGALGSGLRLAVAWGCRG